MTYFKPRTVSSLILVSLLSLTACSKTEEPKRVAEPQVKQVQAETWEHFVTRQIEAGSREAKSKAEAYNVIPPYRRPVWTIAAFVKQGRVYEVLARAVLNTPFVVPNDLKKKMRGLPDYAQDDIKIQVEDAIRQVLDAKVRPIECLAVVRYALAARAAKVGSIDNEYSQQAISRLAAYGDERIAQCIAERPRYGPICESAPAFSPARISKPEESDPRL